MGRTSSSISALLSIGRRYRYRVPVTALRLSVLVLLLSCSRLAFAHSPPRYHSSTLHNSKLRGLSPSGEPYLKLKNRRRVAEDKNNKNKDEKENKDKTEDKNDAHPPSLLPSKSPTSQPSFKPEPTEQPLGSSEPTTAPSTQPPLRPTLTLLPTLNKTPYETIEPTFFPAVTTPPSAPLVPSPPIQPTEEPATSPPSLVSTETQAGTQSPSFVDTGVIFLRFSLIRPTPVKAIDVMLGGESELTQAVMDALLFILCVETDFIIGPIDGEGAGICHELRSLVEDVESESVISDAAILQVEDGEHGELEWTEWSVAFNVLRIGADFRQMALQQVEFNCTEEHVKEVALEYMRENATTALEFNIQNNRLDVLIGHKVQTSLVGEEIDMFSSIGGLQREPTDLETMIRPSVFHTLRVVGIVLLILNICIGYFVLKQASRQKKRLEMEALVEKKDGGGLHTEEALDIMLDLGRDVHWSEHIQPSPGLKASSSYTDCVLNDNALSMFEPLSGLNHDARHDHAESDSPNHETDVGLNNYGDCQPSDQINWQDTTPSCLPNSRPFYPSPLQSGSPPLNDTDPLEAAIERRSNSSFVESDASDSVGNSYLPDSLHPKMRDRSAAPFVDSGMAPNHRNLELV